MAKPRTPEFFPRMKVRGARRRRLAPFQRVAGAFRRMGVQMVSTRDAMEAFSKILKEGDL